MPKLRSVFVTIVAAALFAATPGMSDEHGKPLPKDLLNRVSTTDHSKLRPLQKTFTSGPEVTAACLTCHTEVDDQAMHSIHFTWDYDHPVTGQKLGKRNVINAFCGSVAGNEPRCTSCHAGYGWEDMSQPPPQEKTAVDCLICHDTTGTYTKVATMAGHPPLDPVPDGATDITGKPAVAVDLAKVAQNVGMPSRDNCGQCHFYGGGGDNVKHGDLSSALYNPDEHVDVHMASDGLNFTCSTCHSQQEHVWAGSRYNLAAKDMGGTGKPHGDRFSASCESCHSATPHGNSIVGLKLNDHTDKVACQTCHIPEYAKGGIATKSYWDWSTAGKMNAEGKPFSEENYVQGDGKHLHTYISKKGDFEWAEDVAPSYAWFNGVVEYTNDEKQIDPEGVAPVNSIQGDPQSGDSRIWPFKVMKGRQAYDSVNNTLVYTHVFGPKTDTAFWKNYDWAKAIQAGMEAAGKADSYSGEFGFVDTEMYWPITHMVAPAEEAMDCRECHSQDGRLVNIAGVYMPGTEDGGLVGLLGKMMVLAVALGVAGHALLRKFASKKEGGDHG
ncbi:tetrathionate reductase family octaheme c-type cytochrome [Tropicimonas sp. TH_r6]|uniref:tetrathionate reductase family octaheme c-type cytochrome n=1 Tax=Tropicimonas sp. TH_r6 TaxID=3082085 RepID=UPI0029544F11|nr:tetrathionate reductase family octaheme c-type cytochrome [Tropicimonas sp. TH_r6]MDV7141349.1 tetrathionate reductase family octaheme c-type cytochrome [Tropicimonas sp. TH_r6]